MKPAQVASQAAVAELDKACEDLCERVEQHCKTLPRGTVSIEKAAKRARAKLAALRREVPPSDSV